VSKNGRLARSGLAVGGGNEAASHRRTGPTARPTPVMALLRDQGRMCTRRQRMWYAIHCEAQRDRQVERLLAHAGMETFAARVPTTRKRNGDKALFPRLCVCTVGAG
jgi:hypothetical protein